MAKISATEVNKLRKSTGAGMMDCKKALEESSGNFELAIEILRKKGQKVAANRADRDSSEGVAIARVSSDKTMGIIISLNCETDFVAKNNTYIQLANKLADLALGYNTKESFLSSKFDDKLTVNEKLTEQTGVIGEKIEIGSFKFLEANYVGSYIHAGNKIASIVGLSYKDDNAEKVSKNIAMQVAAMNPIALDEHGVSKDILDKEIEIAKDQLRQQGKPEAMLDNIVKGKIKRFLKDNTLVNQIFIKDNKINVSQYAFSINPKFSITGFERISLQ
jgi:elongation factor Ts|tara:strand:+ start:323 stop:1150 length:828 start_codon:yes stop_codon:yes gene_type:complete